MYIYRRADIKVIEANAETKGLDTFTLMENAGRSIFEAIENKIMKQNHSVILAGIGKLAF